MARSRGQSSATVELLLIASVALVAVLVLGWLRMPDVERGVKTLTVDVAQRLGIAE
ncbi:MAG: hypothetical protein GXP62_05285 [Oligoflexia bacterium]|nr:hypothetical protein [Oligoflexia bacterium]